MHLIGNLCCEVESSEHAEQVIILSILIEFFVFPTHCTFNETLTVQKEWSPKTDRKLILYMFMQLFILGSNMTENCEDNTFVPSHTTLNCDPNATKFGKR